MHRNKIHLDLIDVLPPANLSFTVRIKSVGLSLGAFDGIYTIFTCVIWQKQNFLFVFLGIPFMSLFMASSSFRCHMFRQTQFLSIKLLIYFTQQF